MNFWSCRKTAWYVYCDSLLTKLGFHKILLIKPFFLHDHKVKTKLWISWVQKELLRWNKKHFSSLLKGFHWKYFFGKVRVWRPITLLVKITIFKTEQIMQMKASQFHPIPPFIFPEIPYWELSGAKSCHFLKKFQKFINKGFSVAIK